MGTVGYVGGSLIQEAKKEALWDELQQWGQSRDALTQGTVA